MNTSTSAISDFINRQTKSDKGRGVIPIDTTVITNVHTDERTFSGLLIRYLEIKLMRPNSFPRLIRNE